MYDIKALYEAENVADAVRLLQEHPEAQIIAGGSIDIRGACKGVVHAGAYGDTTAFVVADQLMPTQIRIADRIAQPPENMKKPKVAERASIKDGKIVIEPMERQEIKA